jgi:hypothetical protein
MKPHNSHYTCRNGEITYYGRNHIQLLHWNNGHICKGWAQVWATILVKLHLLASYEISFLIQVGDVRCCTFCPKGCTLRINPKPNKVSSSLPLSVKCSFFTYFPLGEECLCVMQPWPLISINLSCTTNGAPQIFFVVWKAFFTS